MFVGRFEELAFTSESDKANPRGCPLDRAKFDHLPPALMILAELDPLRDIGYGKHYQPKAFYFTPSNTHTLHLTMRKTHLL